MSSSSSSLLLLSSSSSLLLLLLLVAVVFVAAGAELLPLRAAVVAVAVVVGPTAGVGVDKHALSRHRRTHAKQTRCTHCVLRGSNAGAAAAAAAALLRRCRRYCCCCRRCRCALLVLPPLLLFPPPRVRLGRNERMQECQLGSVTINLTTDDGSVLDYFNSLDTSLGARTSELEGTRFDVIDDVVAESREVARAGNRFLNYCLPVHACRMAGCNSPVADELDERVLPPHYVAKLCREAVGGLPPDTPHFSEAGGEAYVAAVRSKLATMPEFWDPVGLRRRPLVDVAALPGYLRARRSGGGGAGCVQALLAAAGVPATTQEQLRRYLIIAAAVVFLIAALIMAARGGGGGTVAQSRSGAYRGR
jgi:hypothetical protein